MDTTGSRGRIAMARRTFRGVGTAAIDIVYPRRCAACRQRGTWVCAACLAQVEPFRDPVCAGCGIPLGLGVCHCSDMVAGLEQIRSVGPFSGWLRDAILSFKYEEEWARADHLGQELARAVTSLLPADALVPVPLHRSRLRARGYNQSALLARVAAEVTGVPMVEALTRTRATAQQTLLSAAQRAANVAGAFALTPGFDPAGRALVLIDDVVTTGSTLNACAHLLTSGGATVVRAVTAARQL